MEKSKCVKSLDDFLKSFNFRNRDENNNEGKEGRTDRRENKTRLFNDYDNPNKKLLIQQYGFKQNNQENKPSNENESSYNNPKKVVKRAVVSYDDL